MNAIVPLNVSALRVSLNDSTNVVVNFKGRVGNFNQIPWSGGNAGASTGDTVVQPLDSTSSPLNPLGPGIHVHWELPDYFRRGVQALGSEEVLWPQAPNRWLVTRWLSAWNATSSSWGPAQPASWVVESDYVSSTLTADPDGVLRPAAPIPLQIVAPQPYGYMGRVVSAAAWNPASERASQFLPGYLGADGKPAFLTANGFLGPGFSSYYPDCCSVFGFWDRFLDQPQVAAAIAGNQPVQFRASYQVTGWIDPGAVDPLDGIADLVRKNYDQYVAQCAAEGTEVATTPAEVFGQLVRQRCHWTFDLDDIHYTLNADGTLDTLDLPQKTLCAGVLQEVVWNNLTSPQTSYFLNTPSPSSTSTSTGTPGVWTDTVKLAVGNTPSEALSALLKADMGNEDDDPDLLANYEYLLDALQLGMLHDLESQGNMLITLEESLHTSGFARQQGGVVWVVQSIQPADASRAPTADAEVTLPLDLAESLALLNGAQKSYDMARDGLEVVRRQLFMDWFRYVKMYAGGVTSPNVTLNALTNFMATGGTGSLARVQAAGTAAGVLAFTNDPVTGAVTGIVTPGSGVSPTSAAYTVYDRMRDFLEALAPYASKWQVLGVPAPPFWQATDPAVLVEGNRIEPVRRNGTGADLAVRLTGELVQALSVAAGEASFTVPGAGLAPDVPAQAPYADDVRAVLAEAALLVPSLAPAVASALAAQGGAGNPAAADAAAFAQSLNAAQGGLSPVEAGGPGAGLFAAVRADGYTPAANPRETVAQPQALTFTFTNAASDAWAPDAVGWNAQQAYPELSATRLDPFLPVSLIWTLSFDPLKTGTGGAYAPTTLTDWFALDEDAIDYQYRMDGGVAAPFTLGSFVQYTGAVALSKKPTFSLTRQIDSYVASYPADPANPTLQQISAYYQDARMMAQAMSGFGVTQKLQAFIAQIPVEDLTRGARDTVTTSIDAAAKANPDDDWYDLAFNSRAPVATGLQAQLNFGPLRSGFLEVNALEIVDVWGQRMVLSTAEVNADGSLQAIPALTMAPMPGDTAHAGMIYLPPRVGTGTRLWFRWLSATHNDHVAGISSDFVEMSTHPATSPACGWIVPSHLDNSLFFYDAPGTPIGSFGVEHGTLVYRTRAGNTANPGDSLELDIGPPGAPTVNAHTAAVMWHVDGMTAAFLADLVAAILGSDGFINPGNAAQDPSLAVLIGQPLAITRAVLGMETAGNLLPIDQADVSASDPWPQDVNQMRTAYTDRMAAGSAGLGGVEFPVRLGDLSNIDDGLVGYFIESAGDDPYSTFYAPAAPAGGENGVARPNAQTLQLTLNASPKTLTLFVDPRAAVHATVGVLPVEELSIPPDQYQQTLKALQVTFFTLPVLNERQGLVLPLPAESGYAWSWVSPGVAADAALAANASNGNAVWDYTPQTLLEGWLKLVPDPNKLSS